MRNRVLCSFLLAVGIVFLSTPSFSQIGVSVSIAPPALPVYEQPMCPGDGYIWTPGYWAWDGAYYWVSGDWVMAPEAGYLWTPGYWGWGGDGFMFNEGYWGLSVGFYGGIDYGFGYFGRGYEGGRWDNGRFFYNSTLNNVNRNSMHNVYDTRVNDNRSDRVSYNGGNGGINAHANSQEEAAAHDRHIAPVSAQTEHAQSARNDPQQRFSANHGAPAGSAAARSNNAVHPKDLPAIEHPASPNTGNAKLDQKYQKQQDKLAGRQNQDRQKLQQQQDKEHQQFAKQQSNAARSQQQEQRHQQQTQQMQQRHSQQTQQMSQRQSGGGQSRGGGESRGGGGGGRR
jgi:hypothetical protein